MDLTNNIFNSPLIAVIIPHINEKYISNIYNELIDIIHRPGDNNMSTI